MGKIMSKYLLTPLALLIFAPAGLLWLVAEILYVVVFFFKLFSSILASLAMAARAKIDCDVNEDLYQGDIIGATKRFICAEIAAQMESLRLSSAFFERKQ